MAHFTIGNEYGVEFDIVGDNFESGEVDELDLSQFEFTMPQRISEVGKGGSRPPICVQEKFIFLLDTSTGGALPLALLKEKLLSFVRSRLSMPTFDLPTFAVCIVGSSNPLSLSPFSSDATEISHHLAKAEPSRPDRASMDFSDILSFLASNVGALDEDHCLVRVLVLYQDVLVPTFSNNKQTISSFLQHPAVVIDVLYFHGEPVRDIERTKTTFRWLCDLVDATDNADDSIAKWPSYIFAIGVTPSEPNSQDLVAKFLVLLSHPALRNDQTDVSPGPPP